MRWEVYPLSCLGVRCNGIYHVFCNISTTELERVSEPEFPRTGISPVVDPFQVWAHGLFRGGPW